MMKRRGFVLVMVSFLLALGAAWVAKNWLGLRASTPVA